MGIQFQNSIAVRNHCLAKKLSTMMELDFEDVESYLKSIEVGCDQQMYQVEMMIGDQVPMLSPQVTSSFSIPVEDLYSPYDTKEFPTSLDDLLKMEDLDVFVPINQNNNNYSQYKDLEVKTETLYVPVIQVSQYEMSQDDNQYTSSSDSDDDYVQPNRLSVRKSRKASGSSTASCQDSESEDEWRPEAEDYSPARKNTRRSRRSSGGVVKHTQRRKSKSFSHRPIPQKRSPGKYLQFSSHYLNVSKSCLSSFQIPLLACLLLLHPVVSNLDEICTNACVFACLRNQFEDHSVDRVFVAGPHV